MLLYDANLYLLIQYDIVRYSLLIDIVSHHESISHCIISINIESYFAYGNSKIEVIISNHLLITYTFKHYHTNWNCVMAHQFSK